MDELIRKQTVLNMIDDVQFGNITHKLSQLHEAVRNLPSVDAVEVVRCGECKHWVRDGNESYGYAMFCKADCSLGGQGIKKPDDFCSYGERKADG